MIRIDVEDYCQGCLDFTPDLIKPVRVETLGSGLVAYSDTVIQCENRKRCAHIVRYLRHQCNLHEGE